MDCWRLNIDVFEVLLKHGVRWFCDWCRNSAFRRNPESKSQVVYLNMQRPPNSIWKWYPDGQPVTCWKGVKALTNYLFRVEWVRLLRWVDLFLQVVVGNSRYGSIPQSVTFLHSESFLICVTLNDRPSFSAHCSLWFSVLDALRWRLKTKYFNIWFVAVRIKPSQAKAPPGSLLGRWEFMKWFSQVLPKDMTHKKRVQRTAYMYPRNFFCTGTGYGNRNVLCQVLLFFFKCFSVFSSLEISVQYLLPLTLSTGSICMTLHVLESQFTYSLDELCEPFILVAWEVGLICSGWMFSTAKLIKSEVLEESRLFLWPGELPSVILIIVFSYAHTPTHTIEICLHACLYICVHWFCF